MPNTKLWGGPLELRVVGVNSRPNYCTKQTISNSPRPTGYHCAFTTPHPEPLICKKVLMAWGKLPAAFVDLECEIHQLKFFLHRTCPGGLGVRALCDVATQLFLEPPIPVRQDSPAAYFLSFLISRLRRNATMSARSDVLRT